MADWTWAAASRRGTAHAEAGDRRQDACRILTAEPKYLIAVACDGAGSTSFGGYGAAIAARVLSTRAQDWIKTNGAIPTPALIELWIAEVRLMIMVSADRIGCATADFATTLVLVVSNGTQVITAHIGDGAIVARRAGSTDVDTLSWPHNGEYASTTFFVTDAAPSIRIGVISNYPIDRLALMTDGLERLALDFVGGTPHQPFFHGVFGTISAGQITGPDRILSRRLAAFLDSDSVNARTDDDKTLILAALG